MFTVRSNLRTLAHLQGRRELRAEAGQAGSGRRKHGRDGKPLNVAVPPGTTVREAATGRVLRDLTVDGEQWVCLDGGRGGAGNAHFATAARRAPRFAKPGGAAQSLQLEIELRTIADVGLVGLPNAGKSTLLGALTNAQPRVGAYPFTTTTPHLGILRLDADLPPDAPNVVIADIPGILEGAAQGVGLGLRFLDHIARTRLLAFLIDVTAPHDDPLGVLRRELAQHDPALAERERIVVGTKADLDADDTLGQRLRERYSREQVYVVSAHTGYGLAQLGRALVARAPAA